MQVHHSEAVAIRIRTEPCVPMTRRYLLDFGFTPDVYANNLELLKIDVAQVDALIISHGHYDHTGGLMGFLQTQRPKLRKDIRLYTGGEDDFCHRYLRSEDGSFTELGTRWTGADCGH